MGRPKEHWWREGRPNRVGKPVSCVPWRSLNSFTSSVVCETVCTLGSSNGLIPRAERA